MEKTRGIRFPQLIFYQVPEPILVMLPELLFNAHFISKCFEQERFQEERKTVQMSKLER